MRSEASGAYHKDFFTSIQEKLSRLVRVEPFEITEGLVITALDVAYRGERACSAAFSCLFSTFEKVDEAIYLGKAWYPYVSGLLYVREAPLLLETIASLKTRPGLLLVDGHGLAHPRLAGLASIIGVLTDIPSIGIAKRPLSGSILWIDGALGVMKVRGMDVGYVFKSRNNTQYYVSIGHKVDMDTLRRLIEIFDYKYPEPLAIAHRLAEGAAVLLGHGQ